MDINGIDVSALEHSKKDIEIPVVPGRVVHIDGDFLAYMVAYDDTKSIEEMRHNCLVKADKIQRMAGAESRVLHLTHKDSDKGQRKQIALLREYQENRKKIKPKYLHLIRAYMKDELEGVYHMDKEADDGMSIAQYDAIKAGKRKLSVIATKDKDLCMVPGLLLDWDTGSIEDTKDDFGEINLSRDKSQPKIRGRGWKMFWAQMLTGDSADNISGLPMCCNLDYLPRGKHKACGPVLAYEILAPLTTNKEAFKVVKQLFYDYHNVVDEKGKPLHPFTDYRTGRVITPGEAFISEAQLLWMRRNNDQRDVINWLMETAI